jgi:hypothetical protein
VQAVATPEIQSPGIQLGEPFVLHWMETAVLAEEQLEIQFIVVLDDWRCPVSDGEKILVCESQGAAEILLFVDHASQGVRSVTLTTDSEDVERNQVNVGSFTIQLLGLQPVRLASRQDISQEEYAATLRVTASEEMPHSDTAPTPQPTYLAININCNALSSDVAEAVLGEAVRPDRMLLNFFCIAGSVARSEQPAPADFPIYPGDFADHYLVATTQWKIGNEPDPLLALAERLRAAHPEGDATPWYKMQSYYAAGLMSEAFAQMPALAEGAETVRVEPVEGVGDAAFWFWQTYPDGRHFAALLTVNHYKYGIVYALANPSQQPEAARAAMITLGARLLD